MDRSLRSGSDVTRLRRASTFQQQKLWVELRRRSLAGFVFVQKAPVLGVVVDFYCAQRNLIVEVDADRNDADDAARDAMLRKNGLQVLRFTDDEVDADIEAVVEVIRRAVVQSVQPAA